MDFNSILEKNGLYFCPVNGFASVKLELRFFISNEKYDVVKARLLSMYLMRINCKYSSRKEIKNKLKEFYNMSLNIFQTRIGSKRFFVFNVKLLNQSLIDDYYFKDAFLFAKDILFEPSFHDGKLDKDVFDQIKKDIINEESIKLSNTRVKIERNLLVESLPECNINKNIVLDIDDFKMMVESISDEDIIDFYNDLISNKFFRGYVFGDVTFKEFDMIRNYFPFKACFDGFVYADYVSVNCGSKEVADNTINDSSLYVVYQINNYSLDKWFLYRIIQVMLSNSNGLCHKVLRNERGLVYSAGSYINKYRFWGFIVLVANIHYRDKEKCLEGIREIFDLLKDESIVEELLSFVKDKFNQEDMVCDELVQYFIEDVEDFVFNERPTKQELHVLTNNVTVQDIINEISNLEEKFIYFYKGVKDEK